MKEIVEFMHCHWTETRDLFVEDIITIIRRFEEFLTHVVCMENSRVCERKKMK